MMLVVIITVLVVSPGGCYGFSPRRMESEKRVVPAIQATQFETKQKSTVIRQTDTAADNHNHLQQQQRHEQGQEQRQDQLYRRRFVSQVLSSVSGGLLVSAIGCPTAARAESESRVTGTITPARIIRLSSGLQFSDQRVGSGPMVQIPKSIDNNIIASSNSNSNSVEGLEPDDPSVVLMHLKALKMDGAVLLDTFEEGKPLLFRLGSIPSELYYLNEGSAIAKGKIPLGVQDAILAQGAASWEGGFGKADAMRTGGIRKIVLPSELAYGTKGVSRYEAFKLGLKQPVARNELLRYEIELLRCNDEVIDLTGSDMVKDDGTKSTAVAARACCLEELYPCKMNGG